MKAAPLLLAAGLALGACQKTEAPQTPPPPPAQVSAPTPTTPPTKMAKMICRNSQTGASVECGTPNAVMVGIKTD